eukprot:144953_1
MASIVALFLSFIPLIQGSSRYFVYTFSNPFGDPSNVPYPLDICVNYELAWHHLRIVYRYAIFSCNANNDGIIMTTYDSDRDCASQGTVANTYSSDSFTNPGDLYSFNCIGEDNYAEAMVYQNDDTCDGTSATSSRIATDVCYPRADGTRYLMSSCDAGCIGSTYSSHTTDCQGSDTSITSANTNECKVFKTSPVNVYIRFNKCVQDGKVIAEGTDCVPGTVLPTKATTKNPSHAPSTALPTSPTRSTTMMPSRTPSGMPSTEPTVKPSRMPSMIPSVIPTAVAASAASWMDDVNPIAIALGGCGVTALLVLAVAYCVCKRRRKRSYTKEEGLIQAGQGHLERIALDDVIEDHAEEEEEEEDRMESEEGEDEGENQEIVGIADEIYIA